MAGGRLFAVPLPTRHHIRFDPVPGEHRQIALASIASIGGELLRLAPGVDLDLPDDRRELLHIGGPVRQTLCHDDLGVGIDRRLNM